MKAVIYLDVWPGTDFKIIFPSMFFRNQLPALVEGAGVKRYLVKFDLPDPVVDGVIKAEVEEAKPEPVPEVACGPVEMVK